jgi:hypothetical protein
LCYQVLLPFGERLVAETGASAHMRALKSMALWPPPCAVVASVGGVPLRCLAWASCAFPLSLENSDPGWLLMQRLAMDGLSQDEWPTARFPSATQVFTQQAARARERLAEDLRKLTEERPSSLRALSNEKDTLIGTVRDDSQWRVVPGSPIDGGFSRSYVLVRDDKNIEGPMRQRFRAERKDSQFLDKTRCPFMHAIAVDVSNVAPVVKIAGPHSWFSRPGRSLPPGTKILKPFDRLRLPPADVATLTITSLASEAGLELLNVGQLAVRLEGLVRPENPANPVDVDIPSDDEEDARNAQWRPRIGPHIFFRDPSFCLPLA